MFESFGGWCGMAIEGNAIAPLPQEFDIEKQLLLDAGKPEIATALELRKPQLIQATNDYTLGEYRFYDAFESLFKTAPTFNLIEDQMASMQEEFYQANKNSRISAVWIETMPDGAQLWCDEDFENLVPNKSHRIYDFETGENVLFATTEEAKAFVDQQIIKVKALFISPQLQQKITYNGDGTTSWLNI